MKTKPKDLKVTKKFTVKQEPKKKMDGWMGMNAEAAKPNKFKKVKLKKNEVIVKKSLNKLVKKRTIRHEEIEDQEMSKGKKYKAAHKIALKAEKKIKK